MGNLLSKIFSFLLPANQLEDEMSEPENWFVKVPDEILQMIISHLPSKLNCFLVSKRFHAETIRATSYKCFVNLTPENVKSSGFMNIRWKFDEIRLTNDFHMTESFASESLKFIKKFGSRVKKLLVYELTINTSDFLKWLRLMPNLIELHVLDCNVQKDYKRFLQSTREPIGILELKLLKKLAVLPNNFGDFDLIDRISCPSLATYCYGRARGSQFLKNHSRTLKDVQLTVDAEAQHEIFQQLRQCHLERLSIDIEFALASTQIVELIESQPQLKSLHLGQYTFQEELEEEELHVFTPELLQRIIKLKDLESLSLVIHIPFGTFFPHPLVRELMQMPKLKSLNIHQAITTEFIEQMLSVGNEQLQSLILNFWSEVDVGISCIGDHFPNLKHLEFQNMNGNPKVNIKFIDRLKKLESLHSSGIFGISLEELEVNESVRFLHYQPKPELNSVGFSKLVQAIFRFLGYKPELDSVGLKLVQAMPNIEKFTFIHYPTSIRASKQLLDKILSLQNLVEIECKSFYLLENEVIASIKNRPQSSKLQRIKLRHDLDELEDFDHDQVESVVETYRDQFPIKRMEYSYPRIKRVTLSRF